MKNDGWVKWTQWEACGITHFGQMRVKDVSGHLRRFSEQARQVMEETGADHVVYGMKLYDNDDDLEEVRFYMTPMNDADFQSDVAPLKGCVIYALHRDMGNCTVRTSSNKVVLSSATSPDNPFYCDREKLADHVGHSLICAGYGKDDLTVISIQCADCASAVFTMIAPGATEEEVSEAMKDGEDEGDAEATDGDGYDYEPPEE